MFKLHIRDCLGSCNSNIDDDDVTKKMSHSKKARMEQKIWEEGK